MIVGVMSPSSIRGSAKAFPLVGSIGEAIVFMEPQASSGGGSCAPSAAAACGSVEVLSRIILLSCGGGVGESVSCGEIGC